jgi:eukaryotic-like serine/threonine-protein kinase
MLTCNVWPVPPVENPLPVKTSPRAVTVDGRYELGRELGRGGMGRVQLAHDHGLDRTVAVKMVDPALAKDASALSLFRREATALARVRSDHVAQVYAFGVHEGSPFFAMEFVEGSDLESIIESYRAHDEVVPLHRAATILRQAASGLAAVHAQKLIHRDLKPSNVLVEAGTGRPVLIDFGLALPQRSPDDAPMTVAGTPQYMAPEQWNPESGEISAATDVYGFGAMAFELLTGRPPFGAESTAGLMLAHIMEEAPRVSVDRPSVAPLDEVIARAMAKSPADRYPDGHALYVALDAALREALPEELSFPRTWMPPPMVDSAQGLKALVVDDDDSFRRFAGRALKLGFPKVALSTREAASGEAALALAEAEMPDLLVLDFDMPGLNGLETLSHLRALPGGSRARVLVVSGSIERIGQWQFDVLGVVDFAEKPIALRELAKIVGGMAKSSGG